MKYQYTSILLFLAFISCCTLQSCEYYDSSNSQAAYLTIDSVSFSTTQGTAFNDQRIGHINVFQGGNFLGGYTLPAKIPIQNVGKSNLTILAGIYADGIYDARVQYPFFEQYKETVTFEPGKSVSVTPNFSYISTIATPCKVQENFETSAKPTLDSLNSTKPFVKIPHGTSGFPFGFSNYGEIRANVGDTALLQIASKGYFQDQLDRFPAYLEFEYKSNIAMIVGILVYENTSNINQYGTVYDLYLLPTEKWTKVYCDLTDELIQTGAGIGTGITPKFYKIFFRGVSDGSKSQYIALDNVRYISNQR